MNHLKFKVEGEAGLKCASVGCIGSADKFSAITLTHLFCPLFVGKSSTEHHSASGLPPQSDEKIYANLTDFILSAIPIILV
ncbi:Na+-transporting methylmalonyl-CoA/oxaloacetate decarboxylase [Centipeda periodontii DSM 2778]|uniref:Na+-transporting methylmalonyl-CoA/oxaloacetate decarboxylase n=1 Tax=Centipeda periodontii DSM 2778 TaxID=888060 RepID=F5RK92_9FIRM|nr:Na+-transporting methylmalonyl-CoA/oxaloacetate decarboxylase [Centipeda periodontii DSM 2778]